MRWRYKVWEIDSGELFDELESESERQMMDGESEVREEFGEAGKDEERIFR